MGVYSGIDEVAYKRLSSIAPTVVYRSGPWSADWREQTTIIGEALGKSEEAASLIEGTNEHLRDLGNAHPELRDKTFTFGTFFPGGNGIVVYLPRDPRIAALMELGMQTSKGVTGLSKSKPEETSVTVPIEDIASIDADILIMWYGPGARAAAEAQPMFNTLDAVKRGSYVALEDPVDVWSTSALSVLSIPYGFPDLCHALQRRRHVQTDNDMTINAKALSGAADHDHDHHDPYVEDYFLPRQYRSSACRHQ